MTRVGRAKAGLAQFQRSQGSSGPDLPDNVSAARNHLDAQVQAVQNAMRMRDNNLAEQNLKATEETVTVIEQFLAK